MQCIPGSMKKWNPIECREFNAAWLNAVDTCSMIECCGLLAARPKVFRMNAVDTCSMIECRGFFAAWPKSSRFNAGDFLQHVPKHPDWIRWITCSMIECSGFYAAWPKASRLNAVDSMQRHWMQKTPCIVAQWIPYVFSWVHAVRPNASRLNAVGFMQHCQKYPDWVQWIPCSVIECSGFHALWLNAV